MNKSIARGALFVLAGLGCFAGARLSLEHIQHGEICPLLGPVPACIIVCLGYLGVLLAAIFRTKPFARTLFYLGWVPVFGLALMGVVLELSKGDICPSGAAGIPQCFFSLGMAMACLILFKATDTNREH